MKIQAKKNVGQKLTAISELNSFWLKHDVVRDVIAQCFLYLHIQYTSIKIFGLLMCGYLRQGLLYVTTMTLIGKALFDCTAGLFY